jgi:hypothetical protein
MIQQILDVLGHLTASDYAAWWGAIVGTFALGWEIVTQVRSGPRIRVRARADMQIVSADGPVDDSVFVMVVAINRGTGPTTITHLCGHHYTSLWKLLLRRRHNFVILKPEPPSTTLPHMVGPGEEWRGMADQMKLQKGFAGGYLYLGVAHNQAKRAVVARVRLPRPAEPASTG